MSNLTSGVVSIDNGGHSTILVNRQCEEKYLSVKGLYNNGNLTTINGKYDFIVEYKNSVYVMSDLAKYDCEMPLQMFTKTKQNLFYDLSVLVGLHQFSFLSNYIVISVPIEQHTATEKEGLVRRLKGTHTLTVNGVTKTFVIADVKVAPEGASAFFINQPVGKSKYLDIGSRTVNAASCVNIDDTIRFIDSESLTLYKGIETFNNGFSPKGLADYICGKLLSIWDTSDIVYIHGGGALNKDLCEGIKEYFPRSEVMESPQYANARGMYLLGKTAYGMN